MRKTAIFMTIFDPQRFSEFATGMQPRETHRAA
jgi:hypothetical protein